MSENYIKVYVVTVSTYNSLLSMGQHKRWVRTHYFKWKWWAKFRMFMYNISPVIAGSTLVAEMEIMWRSKNER